MYLDPENVGDSYHNERGETKSRWEKDCEEGSPGLWGKTQGNQFQSPEPHWNGQLQEEDCRHRPLAVGVMACLNPAVSHAVLLVIVLPTPQFLSVDSR